MYIGRLRRLLYFWQLQIVFKCIFYVMNDLNEFFTELLMQHRSIDIAESEFRRMLDDDEELRIDYKEWCDERGCTEKHGFRDFCEEYLETQDSIWESLNDYDE